MKFLLDSDICVELLRWREPVVSRVRRHSPADLAITTMTLAELEYGVLRHPRPEIARARLDTLLSEPIEILVFDSAAATVHAELRHAIRARPIGAHDLIIASIAVARGIVLVTRNLREFERVPDLAVEDWTKPE